jgi:hypothetical protein
MIVTLLWNDDKLPDGVGDVILATYSAAEVKASKISVECLCASCGGRTRITRDVDPDDRYFEIDGTEICEVCGGTIAEQ